MIKTKTELARQLDAAGLRYAAAAEEFADAYISVLALSQAAANGNVGILQDAQANMAELRIPKHATFLPAVPKLPHIAYEEAKQRAASIVAEVAA